MIVTFSIPIPEFRKRIPGKYFIHYSGCISNWLSILLDYLFLYTLFTERKRERDIMDSSSEDRGRIPIEIVTFSYVQIPYRWTAGQATRHTWSLTCWLVYLTHSWGFEFRVALDRLPPSFPISLVRKMLYFDSFFTTDTLWKKKLPRGCSTSHYNHNLFESRFNCYQHRVILFSNLLIWTTLGYLYWVNSIKEKNIEMSISSGSMKVTEAITVMRCSWQQNWLYWR